jgi:hypothetical protein
MEALDWILSHWEWDLLAIGLALLFAQVREVDRMRVDLAKTLSTHLTQLVEADQKHNREIDALRIKVRKLEMETDSARPGSSP